MLTFVHRIDHNNLGDMVCCPVDYFDWSFVEHRVQDIHGPFPSGSNYIFGGGGLLHGAWVDALDQFSDQRSPGTKAVVWSAGVNTHYAKSLIWPKFLDRFDLVGLRDWGNPWRYVPCVSCMHSAFNWARGLKPTCDAVIYEHKDRRVDIDAGFSRMNNARAKESMGDTLQFLASGRVVITNSFHGAYWALLLSRVPLMFSPFSNRFFSFQNQNAYCEWYNWHPALKSCMSNTPSYLPWFYDECVDENRKFFKTVKDALLWER